VSARSAVGEGSVFQRKDGRWVAAAFVPTVQGGRRRVAQYGKTKAEDKAALREMIDRAAKDIPAAPPGLNVQDYLAEWLTHMERHVRPSTLKAYKARRTVAYTSCRESVVRSSPN